MPGFFPHLFAGCAVFIFGMYYFKNYFNGMDKNREKLLLAIVCISFSIMPDFFLIIYYTFQLSPFVAFLHYHEMTHYLLVPISFGSLLILKFKVDVKWRPIWIMGFCCILLHLTMDLFIRESGIWI